MTETAPKKTLGKVVCQTCGEVLDYSDEFVQVRYGMVTNRGKVGYYHTKPVDYFHLDCQVAIRRLRNHDSDEEDAEGTS